MTAIDAYGTLYGSKFLKCFAAQTEWHHLFPFDTIYIIEIFLI
jgi:hypothetical protein